MNKPVVSYEKMADFFHKLHLGDGSVIHAFTDRDNGDPHDHPFDFTSEVLVGGYVEEVYDPQTGFFQFKTHEKGDRFEIRHDHVHRIVRLLEPVVVTRIHPGPWIRDSGFWQFRLDGSYRRPHYDREGWERIYPNEQAR